MRAPLIITAFFALAGLGFTAPAMAENNDFSGGYFTNQAPAAFGDPLPNPAAIEPAAGDEAQEKQTPKAPDTAQNTVQAAPENKTPDSAGVSK